MSNAKLKKVAAALPGKVRALASYELFELGKNARYTIQSMLQTVFEAALPNSQFSPLAAILRLFAGSTHRHPTLPTFINTEMASFGMDSAALGQSNKYQLYLPV